MTFLEAFRSGPFHAQFHFMEMLPDFTILSTVAQSQKYHPEGDVKKHTVEVARQMFLLCQQMHLTEDERAILMLSAWMHDLGKIISEVNPKTNEISSIGHADRSAKMARVILEANDVPENIINAVCGLCREHMNHTKTDRALVRMHDRLANDGATMEQFIALKIADKWGRPPHPRDFSESLLETVTTYEEAVDGVSSVLRAARQIIS